MKLKRIPYFDLHILDEDQRIDEIGRNAMVLGKVVGVLVDSTPGKAERYVAKLRAKFPGIKVLSQTPGLVRNVVTIRVGPPVKRN